MSLRAPAQFPSPPSWGVRGDNEDEYEDEDD